MSRYRAKGFIVNAIQVAKNHWQLEPEGVGDVPVLLYLDDNTFRLLFTEIPDTTSFTPEALAILAQAEKSAKDQGVKVTPRHLDEAAHALEIAKLASVPPPCPHKLGCTLHCKIDLAGGEGPDVLVLKRAPSNSPSTP